MILTNARVVTRERAFIGTVEVMEQHIVAVYRGPTSLSGAIDFDGDYLLPGLIELRTCNMCRHLRPRPGVRHSILSAILAHDADLISAGITTAFGRVRCGDADPCLPESAMGELAAAFQLAGHLGLIRSDHCFAPGVVIDGKPAGHPRLGPSGCAPPGRESSHPHREAAAEGGCRGETIPEAPGDAVGPPATPTLAAAASAAECACPGLCEYPASIAMAQAARAVRAKVMVAATSLIGESVGPSQQPGHRESALMIAAENLVDILSSDDYPPSLLQGAFRMQQSPLRMTLSEAIATVSATPAQVAGLTDRGEIAPGKRADLIRVRSIEALPVAREVWRAGVRVY